MATEYSRSYGLANLTIAAPWFDSNNCESINETGLRHSLSNGFDSQENLRIPDTDLSGCFANPHVWNRNCTADDATKGPLCHERL